MRKIQSGFSIQKICLDLLFQWLSNLFPRATSFRSRSYQNLFFFVFQFLLLSLSICNKWKKMFILWNGQAYQPKNGKFMRLGRFFFARIDSRLSIFLELVDVPSCLLTSLDNCWRFDNLSKLKKSCRESWIIFSNDFFPFKGVFSQIVNL